MARPAGEQPAGVGSKHRAWSAGLLGAGLAAFVLAAVAISLQAPTQEFAVRVWSQPRWHLGGTAGLRVAAVDPEVARLYSGAHFTVTLRARAGAASRVLAEARADGRALSTTVRVPADLPPGLYDLLIEARLHARRAATRESIELVPADAAGAAALPRELAPASPPPSRGAEANPAATAEGAQFSLYPEGGGLVPSLPNLVYVLATDGDGAPRRAQGVGLRAKRAKLERPLPSSLRTDAAGLAELELHSGFQELLLELWPLEGGPSQELFLRGEPVQVVARTPAGPLPRPNAPLELRVQALSESGLVHADLYAGRRWLAAVAGPLSGGGATLQLPAEAVDAGSGPLRVEVFCNPVDPGAARFTLWRWPSPPGAGVERVQALRERLLGAGHLPATLLRYVERLPLAAAAVERQAGFLLDQLPRPSFVPPTLEAGATARQVDGDLRRARRYTWVRTALGVLGLLVLVAVVARLWLGQRLLRRRYAEVALELDEPPAHLHRAATLWNVVALVAILSLTMLGMLLLLDHLRQAGS